jgi:hypothetical protein
VGVVAAADVGPVELADEERRRGQDVEGVGVEEVEEAGLGERVDGELGVGAGGDDSRPLESTRGVPHRPYARVVDAGVEPQRRGEVRDVRVVVVVVEDALLTRAGDGR